MEIALSPPRRPPRALPSATACPLATDFAADVGSSRSPLLLCNWRDTALVVVHNPCPSSGLEALAEITITRGTVPTYYGDPKPLADLWEKLGTPHRHA